METTITCIYNNTVKPEMNLKAGYGLSMLLHKNNYNLLIDSGLFGYKLIHNLRILKKNPEDINALILSHGHRDHTGGLKALLKKRDKNSTLDIYLHPQALNQKAINAAFIKVPFGMPHLSKKLKSRVEIIQSEKPIEIYKDIFTTGEIKSRPEKQGIYKSMLYLKEKKYIQDPLYDDISLVVKTEDGIAIICGCCHSGIINTCNHIKKNFNQPIKKIIGGTHMGMYSETDLENTARILIEEFDSPELFLNHCSGIRQIEFLKKIYPNTVSNFPAGMTLQV